MRKYAEWVEIFNANVGVSPLELAHIYGVGTSTIRHHQGRWRRAQLDREPATQRSVRDAAIPIAPDDTVPDPPTPATRPVVAGPVGDETWKVAFIPDAHVPYHDRVAWAVMLAGVREFYGSTPAERRILVVLGDLADWYILSSHSKSRSRLLRLEDEVISVCDALDQLDALGAGWKKYLGGNHEDRWTRYLNDKAPEMFGLCQMEQVLGLERRGWEYTPYRRHSYVGNTMVTHDLQKCGVTAIRLARKDAGCAVMIGHTHRMGAHWMAEVGGPPLASMGFGWLGDPHQVTEYRALGLAQREWIHGFGTGYLGGDGVLWPTPIPIVNGQCRIEGTLVKA